MSSKWEQNLKANFLTKFQTFEERQLPHKVLKESRVVIASVESQVIGVRIYRLSNCVS